MNKMFAMLCMLFLLQACNNEVNKKNEASTTPAASQTPTVNLPFTASYSSNWDRQISDRETEAVLMSYKHWADGNIDALMNTMADTVWVDNADGGSKNYSNADLRAVWTKNRDSLQSVSIEMQTWEKMRNIDKNDSIIVTWYKEVDRYKNGKVDSALYHDINQIKAGKIVWYSQYKRPYKK